MALKDDTQQPIVVNSEKQSLNLEKTLPLSHRMLW